ncbi:hypothetical protein BH11MYX3_BH11MYX3_15760 [soil metagenome]
MTASINHSSAGKRERIRVLAPALVLFGIMLAHGLLETARCALFLVHLGPDQLAWAYLAIAGTALGAVTVVRRVRAEGDPRSTLIGFLAIAAIGTGVLAATITMAPSVVFILYVWSGLVATLLVPSFWMVIDRAVRLADAKRLFAAIGAGGTLGALVGSAVATALSNAMEPRILVTVAAAALAVTTLAAILLAPRGERIAAVPEKPRRLDRSKESARSFRYLRLLLVGGLLATITLTLGDMMFKRVLAERLAAGQLATVLGAIYSGLNLVALVVQISVTRRLLERLGVGGALAVLPVIVVATALGFVATGSAIALIALKLGDGGFRHSVHRVSTEILYMPLASTVRDAAKPIVDVLGQRGGQAVAALLTLLVASGASGTWTLGVMTIVIGALWFVTTVMTRSAYVEQFRATLDAREILRHGRIATLDSDGVAMLTSSLSSPDEDEALAALDLLARRGARVPALVLYHPSPAVVRRALSLLRGELRNDAERVLGHLTAHPDPQIRAAALAASSRTRCHGERLTAALEDHEPAVRAAALVGLSSMEHVDLRVATGLVAMLGGSVADRVALAQAIGRAPHARFRDLLDQLAASPEPAVVREVLEVLVLAPELADVERLTRMLDNPHVRGDVRRVFTAAGGLHFDHLVLALDDPRTPLGVRRHLPRTISRFGSAAAAKSLVARLVREPDGTTEFKILRALGRMRADNPLLTIDPEPVKLYVRRAIEDSVRYARLAEDLAASHPDDVLESGAVLLGEILVEKRGHAIERVFRALGILHPNSDLRSVHDAIVSDDDDRIGAAREILEDLLPVAIWMPLLGVIDPTFVTGVPRPARSYQEVLGALLEDPSDALRCITAHHVAERRLVALRPKLQRLKPTSLLVTQAFEQAIARLDA